MLAKDIIAGAVNLTLKDHLKQQDFKKKGLRFSRRHGRTEQVIWLELSSWNRGAEGSFTIWVSVKFDEMEPERSSSDFFTRIDAVTDLSPAAFNVDAGTDVPELGERLMSIVAEGILTPLNSVTSLADFDALGWGPAMYWGFPARLAYHLGRDEEAVTLIKNEAEFFADRGVTYDELVERYRLHRLRRA